MCRGREEGHCLPQSRAETPDLPLGVAGRCITAAGGEGAGEAGKGWLSTPTGRGLGHVSGLAAECSPEARPACLLEAGVLGGC